MNDPLPPNPTSVTPAEEPDDLPAMLLGAALIVVVAFIPYVRMACCLPYLLAAVLAVFWFTKKYSLTLSYGRGIRLGILTCLLGGFVSWAIGTVIWLITGDQMGAKEANVFGLWIAEKAGGPEAVEKAKEAMAAAKTQGVTITQVLIGVVSVAVIAAISGVLEGSLGALLFRRGPKTKDESNG